MVQQHQHPQANVLSFYPSNKRSSVVLGEFVREGIVKVNTSCQQHYCGGMPSGSFEARTVGVQMASGMYQFHDLLASHGQTALRKGDLCTLGM